MQLHEGDMGNGSGTMRVRRDLEMDAFDSLPGPVRLALAGSVGNYSAYTLKAAIDRFGLTSRETVEIIHLQDRQMTQPADRAGASR